MEKFIRLLEVEMDDKITVVISLTVIAVLLVWTNHPAATEAVNLIIAGLLGAAVGKGVK